MQTDEERPTFTKEELGTITNDGGGEPNTEVKTDDKKVEQKVEPKTEAKTDDKKVEAKTEDKGEKASLVTDPDAADKKKAAEEEAKLGDGKVSAGDLTAEIRQMIADHYGAGDKKAAERELKRLERVREKGGVAAIWGMYRELEQRFSGGGLIKKPGKDAKPEEVEEFRKSMGVPDKPEDYFKDLKLDNGAEIGEADKPIADGFAAAMHKAGATPDQMNAALNWYYKLQDDEAAALDQADDDYKAAAVAALKEKYGASYRRRIGSIHSLFATAPGGADAKNPKSAFARLLFGRTSDGRIIGDDPEIAELMAGWAHEVNPTSAVEERGEGGKVRSAPAELDEIRALRASDPKKYWSAAVQARELELIAAVEKANAKR